MGKKSSLTEAQVDEVVEAYDCGFGKTIPVLSREYGVAPASIRYRLNQRGVLNHGVPMTQPKAAEATASPPAAPVPDLSALMTDPTMKEFIARAVADRVAEIAASMAPSASAPAPAQGNATDNFAGMMSRMFEVLSMQQPGYQKPLAPDEIERRLAGKVEMEALLAAHKHNYETGSPAPLPKWRVGEKGFFECVDAIELHEGDIFATYIAPVEDFEPQNAEARAVHAAMMKWLGGPSIDIGEQVKNAHLASHERVIAPGAMTAQAPRGPIQILERAVDSSEPPRPKRQMGTIVEEPRQIVGGGASGEPRGPVYENA